MNDEAITAVAVTASDDETLMRRVQASDDAALATLMERWELPLKSVLVRLVQNASEAEELAQETFVRVWQQRGKFREGGAFRSWLFAIGVNLARNRLRWWRRRPVVSFDGWEQGNEPVDASQVSAPRELERRERAEAVKRAVGALPVELREALVLFEYERMSHAEIAEALGCTAKAVESRLYRAREKLRGMLGGLGA